MITPTYLYNKNKHLRDSNISFFEDGHRYVVNGKTDFTSTTTFIHSLFSIFDTESVISSIMKKKDWFNNPDYKYYRMTSQQIADIWKQNSEIASKAGTNMHYNIECFFNNMQFDIDLKNGNNFASSLIDFDENIQNEQCQSNENIQNEQCQSNQNTNNEQCQSNENTQNEQYQNNEYVIFTESVEDQSKEFQYFKNFVKEIVIGEELEPYRTEMLIYDEDVKITGSIDMLYRKKNGEFAIFDWKRSKEISYEGFRGKKSHIECIKHLNDSNFWHYSLQLNIYRYILQKNYGFIVSDLRLVILHPDNDNYICLTVPFLDKEINDLFETRKNNLNINY